MKEEEPEEETEPIREDILEMDAGPGQGHGGSNSVTSTPNLTNTKTAFSLTNDKKYSVVTLKEEDFQMIYGNKAVRKPTPLAVEVVNRAVNDNIVRLMGSISEGQKRDLANSRYSVFFKKYSQLVTDLTAEGATSTAAKAQDANLATVTIIPPLKHKPRSGLTFSQRLANLRKPIPKPYSDAEVYIWRANGDIESVSPLSPPPIVSHLVLGECPTATLRDNIVKNLQTQVRRAPNGVPIQNPSEYAFSTNQPSVRGPFPTSTPLSNQSALGLLRPDGAAAGEMPASTLLTSQSAGPRPMGRPITSMPNQPLVGVTVLPQAQIPLNLPIPPQQLNNHAPVPLSPPPSYVSIGPSANAPAPGTNVPLVRAHLPPVRIPNTSSNNEV